MANYYVRHPQHPRAHLQKTKSLKSETTDQNSMNFGLLLRAKLRKTGNF
jgi:hypothetical protein